MATEYDVTIVLPGDVESLRPRVASALERMGYRVVGEQPLQAKRNSNGWELITMNVLDYAINIMIQMKPTSEGATLVTFDYLIHDPVPPFGWRQIIDCEAKAIGALASQSLWSATCSVCNTDSSSDSRFCRRCGAPLAPPEPSELEVLRATAESRAAYNDVTLAAILILVSGLISFALAVGGYTPMKLMTFLFLVNALGWIPLFFGIRRLRRALKPADQTATEQRAEAVATTRIPALPPKPVAVSVTENTTELLEQTEEAAPAKLRPPSRDTA
jgi:hypothetical protein